MNIKELNQITGDILNYEAKVAATSSYISDFKDLNNGRPSATMTLKLGTNCRFEYKTELTKEEVCAIMERKLFEEKEILEKLNERYKELMNEATA